MKRIISVLLAMVLICGVLASCNNVGPQNESSEPVSEVVSESSEPIENTPRYIEAEIPYYDIDFEPKADIHEDYVSEIVLIREYSEFIETKENYNFDGDEFISFLDTITEDFFDTNALILIPVSLSSIGPVPVIKTFLVEGEKLVINLSIHDPTVGSPAVSAHRLFAVLKKDDVKNITTTEITQEIQYWQVDKYYLADSFNLLDIDYVSDIYDGTFSNFKNVNKNKSNSGFGWMEIIHNSFEWSEIINKYTFNGDGKNLNDLSQKYNDDFFETKSVIALPFKSKFYKTSFSLKSAKVYFSEYYNRLYLETTYNEYDSTQSLDYNKIIIVEIDKEDIPEQCEYVNASSEINFGDPKGTENIDFVVNKFKGCECFGNLVNADDPQANTKVQVESISTINLAELFIKECNDCGRENHKDFVEFLEGLDNEFFESKVLVTAFFCIDKGEKYRVSNVRTEHHEVVIAVDFDDAVSPSSENVEDWEWIMVAAEIDKWELTGIPDRGFRVVKRDDLQ